MIEMRIRPEHPGDEASVRKVNKEAFGGAVEANLVDRLRKDQDLMLSLVAAADGIVGHAAFSRLLMAEASLRAVALAPVAVVPTHQGRGIGSALVRAGLERLRLAGEHLVLVLGEPAFYGRFGFTVSAGRFLTPYDGPSLQALALSEHGSGAEGVVRYPPAFADIA
jgi:putative acetyltransferase